MTGRAEIERQKQKLDATFKRAANMKGDAELLSDFARYLCVLVAGFLEQAAIEIALQHVMTHSQPSIQRHVENRLRRFSKGGLGGTFGGFTSRGATTPPGRKNRMPSSLRTVKRVLLRHVRERCEAGLGATP